MEFQDLVQQLENFKDTEEYQNYIGGFITPDRVGKFLETDNGKQLIQPTLDKYHNKGLESWKTNNLQKLIDDAVSKANPKETAEQKQIRELTERLNKKEAEEKKQSMLNRALLLADEKKLPKEIVENFLGEDDDITKQNLEKLESVFNTHINAVVEKRMSKNSYTPPAGDDKGNKDPFLEGLGL